MEEKPKKKSKKQKNQHPNDQTTKPATEYSFKPCSDVKGLRFGGQIIVKSFTIRRARPPEILRLLSLPAAANKPPTLASAAAFLPTNFTILAHHAWHTLTLGLGTKKSKVVVFVFESEGMKAAVERSWPAEIPLGEVNKKLIRGLTGCEMARFKFRKGCITFFSMSTPSGEPGIPASLAPTISVLFCRRWWRSRISSTIRRCSPCLIREVSATRRRSPSLIKISPPSSSAERSCFSKEGAAGDDQIDEEEIVQNCVFH
ncbi:hypothetical protein ABFS83_06G145800 [Erythranthe nasuta]